MKRRNQVLFMLGIALITGSCSKSENEVTPASVQTTAPTSTVAMKKSPSKPFKGSMTLTPSSVSLNCTCDSGSFPIGTLTGSGNITHLGLTTTNIQPCVIQQPYGFDVANVCGSFFAANGDELVTVTQPYSLFFGPNGASGNIVVNFAGGTGRFVNATGSFTASININLATGAATMNNINGTVSY